MTPAELAELKRLRNAAIAAVALDDGVDRSRKQAAYYNAILGRSDALIAAAEECERLRQRAIVCVWCGKALPYTGDEPPEAVVQEMKDHDATCLANPLVPVCANLAKECSQLRAFVSSLRTSYARDLGPHGPEIRHLVELPMTEPEYLVLITAMETKP